MRAGVRKCSSAIDCHVAPQENANIHAHDRETERGGERAVAMSSVRC